MEVLSNGGIVSDVEGFNGDGITGEFVVAYSKGNVTAGEVNAASETIASPSISYICPGNEGKKYTIIKTDPDAPDRVGHAFREFIHWVVTDISAESLAAGKINGTTALDYLGVGAPCNSGLHRYVFLLFEQPDGCDPAASLTSAFAGRGGKKSCVAAAAAGLGPIVGATWYESQWDESIDAVHEAMGWLPPPEFRSPKQQQANP
jgi:phosphatidylethanolamine-binding protein